MNTTHTPGKWIVRDIPSRDYYIGPADDGGAPSISIVTRRHNRTEAQTEANARLIASAPDLLELVEAFASFLRDDSRSERRRAQCLAECESVLARAKVTS